MALGSYTNGNGNISTFTGNTIVIGNGTTFTTQLKPGAVIGNIGNVFIGYVSQVISNTSAVLSSNANLALSNSSFHYKPLLANAYTFTYNTSGNITANANSYILSGIGTKFTKDTTYGNKIYVTNINGVNVYVGRVELITSDTSLYLNTNAFANVSNVQYFSVTPTTNFLAIGQGSAQDAPNINAGASLINTALYNWASSGYIPNVSIVNNYHPPVRDSITGVLVNLPASIFTRNSNIGNMNYTLGSSISSSGVGYSVTNFDANQSVFGTDVTNVHDALYNSDTLKRTVLNATDITPLQNLVPTTAADAAAQFVGGVVPRVTDNISLAKEYFSTLGVRIQLQNNPSNFGSNQDMSLRQQALGLKKLVATGVPIAIPGLLNVKIDTYNNANISWTPPSFYLSSVK